jgi:glycine betaine/proline transport system permease protein
MLDNIPKLPLSDWVSAFVEFLIDNLDGFFGGISDVITAMSDSVEWVLGILPPLVLILIFVVLAWYRTSWKFALFTLIGLGLIADLGYWDDTVQTLTLIIISVIIAIIIGVPFGIWMSQKNAVQSIITPILDFMQTMPAFVYLIPSVIFFGLGVVPGIIATVIFAMPPAVRLTNLGIRQVPKDLVEASNAFGSTTWQRLMKVQIPLAIPTIMAGINQSIMLSLSMVVIASMVGAPGLGAVVYRSVTTIDVGLGFEGGLSLVIIAIVLDRISQGRRKK